MIIYINKKNTDSNRSYLIPKNDSYNFQEWVEISIDYEKKEFIARKFNENISLDDSWEKKENYTFPSSLFNEFLRME